MSPDSKNKKDEKENVLTEETTHEIAQLARLDLAPEEEKKFTKQLNNILSYFKKISELDTSDVEPRTHPTEITNVFREDKVKPSLSTEEALKNAPNSEKKYFKAPRIV